ncbi:hypothetical protein FRC04_010910 [Tulasnella sp. 424]|nr:hypothetical protein FRC04_010910 [Tulasnella sp. 424]
MPPYRNAQHGGFGSLGSDSVPSKPAVAQDPQEEILWGPRMDNEQSAQAGYPNQEGMADIFEEMARSMREAFPASFEGISANSSTGAAQSAGSTGGAGENATTKPPADGPNVVDPENGSGFSFHFAFTPAEHGLPREAPPPPLFNDHERRPYGFNWNGSSAEGAAHPGSMPFTSSRDSEPNHQYHHEHQRPRPAWTPRGRFTPYGRGGPPPHFHHHHHHHHRPPPFGPGNFPFGFGGPFGHDGPFGFRGRWNPRSPPSPLDEHFAKARQQQQQSWQNVFEKMEEMRSRMHGAGYYEHDYYGSRRGGPHHHTGRGGYQSGSHGRHHSYAGSGGPPPHPRSRSTPNPTTSSEDIPRPRRVDIAKAWETYSAQWKKLTATDAPSTIQLSEIPWPIIVDTSKMKTLSEMASTVTARTVGEFILSAKHSPDVSNKKRIHQALKLYHPDRFETAVVARVEGQNQEAVRELGEVVAKCLNKLLEKEN